MADFLGGLRLNMVISRAFIIFLYWSAHRITEAKSEQSSHPPVHFTNSAMEFHSKRFTILVTLCHTQEGDVVQSSAIAVSSHVLTNRIADHIHWLCIAYTSSLYKSYSKFSENTCMAFIKHIYQLYGAHITLVTYRFPCRPCHASLQERLPRLSLQAAEIIAT